jgi:alpha-mannosidase
VFHIKNGEPVELRKETSDNFNKIETDRLIVEFDERSGVIKRLFDKQLAKEMVKPGGSLGRLEAHYEKPGGMSAWVIGQIEKAEPVFCTGGSSVEQGHGFVNVKFMYTLAGGPPPNATFSQLYQIFHVEAGSNVVTTRVECNWNYVGSGRTPNPMIRVAFDANFENPVATYHVPFGALSRPADAVEYPALQWGSLSDGTTGLSFLNDSKHGYSATGSTMRMSLIRSSFDPDPVPNPGHHVWNYSIYPHEGDWQAGRVTQKAAEFNQPLLQATVPFEAKGKMPLEWSPLQVSDSNVVATGLKVAEDDKDLVLRLYQNSKSPSAASVSFRMPVIGALWVNFLEDRLGVATVQGQRIPLT